MNMKANASEWNPALDYAALERPVTRGKAIRPASHAQFGAEDLIFAVTTVVFLVAAVANFFWLYQ